MSPGPFSVQEDGGTRTSGLCVTPYTTYVPVGGATDAAVVLSHGFSRTEAQMVDLATRIASWGVPVVTTTLCHSTPLDNDPDQDAADLVALADQVGAARRLYVGHSAGGLRSVLAAALDPDAIGVLGLDLVDLDAMAADAAPGLAMPVDGLLGEPYSCNEDGNGLAVYAAAADSEALRVVDADHCDFESPTNWLCTTFCDVTNDTFDDDQVRDAITGLAAGWTTWRSGVDPTASAWWQPHSFRIHETAA
jgi:pimeloyl-ACP methyl ester carboxylesterase